jgi:pyruvate dehydrogenase E2 component (dihydrolipoamide acetyltransferase)
MEFESFMKDTFAYWYTRSETAAVDSLLAIIGDEGEDISALLEEQTSTSEPVKEEETTTKKRRY